MAAITVGSEAEDRGSNLTFNRTNIDYNNPVANDGFITSIEIWALNSMTGLKVATFTDNGGGSFTANDVVSVGNVAAGSKQIIPIPTLTINSGDYIGCWYQSGNIERALAGGGGVYSLVGDFTTGTNIFSLFAADIISLKGIGDTEPPAPSYTPQMIVVN